MSDFSETFVEPTSNDFAEIGTPISRNAPKPLPLATAVLAVGGADDTPGSALNAMTDQRAATAQQLLASQSDFAERIRIAGKRQEADARRIQSMKAPRGIDPEATRQLDDAYRATVQTNIEERARVSAETETVRNIQDKVAAGETVEAKLSYDMLTRGSAQKRFAEEAAKNLVMAQYIERLQAESDEEGIGHKILNFITDAIPFNYNASRTGVVEGAESTWGDFFALGNGLQKAGDTLFSSYKTADDLHRALDGGAADKLIRSNMTTLGITNAGGAAELAKSLSFQSDSDRRLANNWGLGVGALDAAALPWKTAASIPGALMRMGSRSGARDAVGAAWKTVVEDGAEASKSKFGMDEAEVADQLTPSALRPTTTPHEVPVGVDADVHLRAADEAIKNLPADIQVARATNPEEIAHMIETETKRQEALIGKPMKDVEYYWQNVRTGETLPHVVGEIPENGNVVLKGRATIGKKDGGGFATASSAAAGARKYGLAGADIELVEVAGALKTPAELGFTQRVYHGTASAFDDFDTAFAGKATGAENTKGVVFFSDNPSVANSFARQAASAANQLEHDALQKIIRGEAPVPAGKTIEGIEDEFLDAMERLVEDGGANIRPVDINPKNLYVADMKGAGYNGPTTQAIIDEAKKQGKDGVLFKAYDDDILGGQVSDVYAMFNKEAMRPSTASIERDVSGQYFVKHDFIIKEEGFYTAPLNTPQNGLLSFMRSDARRLDRGAQQKAVAGAQNAEKVQSELHQQLQNTLKLIPRAEKKSLDEVIRKGQNESKWLNQGQFETLFERAHGALPSEGTIQAYKQYRLLNDIDFQLRNDAEWSKLAIKGHETVGFDLGNAGRFDGTAQISIAKDPPVDRVFNVSDGVHYSLNNPLTKAELDRLSGEGYILVKAKDTFKLPDGVELRNFLVKRGSLERKTLSRQQLGYVEGGHRMYTGKYFAKQASGGVQPDTGQAFMRNPNVFRTGDNPNVLREWAAVMNKAAADAKSGILDPQHYDDTLFTRGDLHFPTGAEFVEQVEKGHIDLDHPIEIVADREMPSAYHGNQGMAKFYDPEEAGASGYFRTTGRMYNSRRGEHLLDTSGEFAETVDPWETMNTALSNVSRMSSLSNYKTATLERFEKTYGGYLKGYVAGKTTPGEILSLEVEKGIPVNLERQIKAEQGGMKRIMNFETGFEKTVRQVERDLARAILGEATGGPRQAAHDAFYKLSSKNPVGALRGLAFDAKLGMFNIGQLFLQSTTMLATAAIAPKYAMKGMISNGTLYAHTLAKGSESVLDVLAKRSWKVAGFESEEGFKEFHRFVDRSGFLQVGNTHLMINDFGPNRVFGASGLVDGIREKGRTFFYAAEQLNRGMASRIAYEQLREQGLKVGTAEFRERFIGLADDLTFNMTNESAASFQKGVWSIPTQFWAYNVRMMDAMFGKDFLSKEAKARLIASQLLLYGAGGVPVVDALADYAKSKYGTAENTDIHSLLGTLDRGALDKAVNAITGADVLVGDRLGTGAWSTTLVKDIFGWNEYGEKSPAEAFGGATYSIATTTAGPVLTNVINYMKAESGGDLGMLTSDSLMKLASSVSTFSNASRAMLVWNYGYLKSAKGSIQASDLPPQDAFFTALGLGNPAEMDHLAMMSAQLKDRKALVTEAATALRNWKTEAFLNPDKFDENAAKANNLVNLLSPDIKADVLKQTNSMTPQTFYEHVSKQYADQKAKDALNGE